MNLERAVVELLNDVAKTCMAFAKKIGGPYPDDAPAPGAAYVREGSDRTYEVKYVFQAPGKVWQVVLGIQDIDANPFVVPLDEFHEFYKPKPPTVLRLAKDDVPPVDVAVPSQPEEWKIPTIMSNPGTVGLPQQLIDKMSLPEGLLQSKEERPQSDPLGLNEPQPPREDPIPEETGPGTSLADL